MNATSARYAILNDFSNFVPISVVLHKLDITLAEFIDNDGVRYFPRAYAESFIGAQNNVIIEVNGNIFETDCDVIAHGCNCKGGFGSGIAGQIKKLYPEVREAYLKYHDDVGWALGDIQLVGIDNGKVIANCATQDEYLPRGICHADYEAIEKVCYKLKDYCLENNKSLAMPRIGCGLAGGDWSKVKEIYEKVFKDFKVKVYFL